MKKLSILLTLLLLPLAAAMAEEAEIGGIRYNLDAGTKQATVIQKAEGKYEGDIAIPSSVSYGGTSYNVTAIGTEAFADCPNIESITLAQGLKTIEARAFSTNSNKLKDIFVPEGVTEIQYQAFSNNPALESVSLPSSLTSLGGYAFYNSNNIRMVNANSSTPLSISQTLYPYSATLYVPAGSKSAYQSANYWKEFANVLEVGYTGKTDSELTGETDISCFYVNRPGLLGNFFVQAGKPSKVKITGEVTPADLEALSMSGYSYQMYYTNYVDLTETNIHAGSYYNWRTYPYGMVDTPDGYLNADWMGCTNSENDDSGWYGPETIILPNTLTEFEGWATNIYSTQTTPFKTTIREPQGEVYGTPKFYVPAGTKAAWVALTTYPDNVWFYDGPEKTVTVQTAGTLRSQLTTQELATVNELTINGTINAKDFATLKQMTSLTTLYIRANIVAYEGTEGPVSGYTTYRMGEVPAGTFQNNQILQYVHVWPSSGVKGLIIGDYAFDGCTNLTTFGCDGFSSLGDFCFRNTKVMGGLLLLGTTYTYSDEEETYTENNREFEHIGLQPFFGVKGTLWSWPRYSSTIEGDDYNKYYELKNFSVIPKHYYDNYYSGVTNKAETLLYAMTTEESYDLTLPASITTLADYAVSGLELESINLSAVTSIGDGFLYQCPLLKSITSDNEAFKSVDGVLYTADLTTLVKYPCASTAESLTIPATVSQISKWAFEGSQNLKTITMEATTPPTLAGQAFEDFNVAGITLYVPVGSKAAYEADTQWRKFKEIVEMAASSSAIEFADANVKALCVQNWDTDQDGELSEVEAAAVTDLGEVFKDNAEIISFDELAYFSGLTSIGNSAFSGCTSLASVTIPSSVTSIGNEAFADCISLTSIEIPNSVTSIGEWAFASGLTSIVIPNSVTTIGQFAFAYSDLTSVTIGNSVTSISEDAFYSCSDLTEIIVASDNTKYDSRDNCNAIIETATNKLVVGCKNSKIPNTVTTIGYRAFEDCDGLTSVDIPNSVINIGYQAFQSCSGLTTIVIPNSVTTISSQAFYGCKSLTSVTIGNSVTSIGMSAFANCTSLTSVEIPNSVTEICRWAFEGCSNLRSINFRNSVTSIGEFAFYQCTSLTSVSFGNSVTSIEYGAFAECSSLKSVIIPSSVTSIGEGAFYDCSALTSVAVCNEEPVSISSDTFSNSANATLYVPAGTKAAYEAADYWKEFKEIIEMVPIEFADAKVKAICVANWDVNGDGELYDVEAAAVTDLGDVFKENREITSFDELEYFTGLTDLGSAFETCTELRSIVIPVNVVALDAVGNLASLESIRVVEGNTKYDSRNNCNAVIETETNKLVMGCQTTIIPEGITVIGQNAFGGRWGMREINFPASLKTIDESAFAYCISLNNIKLPSGLETIQDGNFGVFTNCYGLKEVIVEWAEPLSIPANTFEDCDLENATLYVPAGTKAVYEAADVWKDFGTIVEISGTIFTAEVNGLQMQFRVTDAFKKEVETYGTYEEGPAIDNQTVGEVVIPAEVEGYTVTGIGGWSFRNCQGITAVSLPTTLTYIGESAFRTCSSLSEVVIPEGVTTIGSRAFYGAGLHKATLPSTLQEIGDDYTFTLSQDDDNIVIVNNPEPIAIPLGAFEWDTMKRSVLIVPLGSREAYQAADVWKEFKAIYDNPVFYSVDVNIGSSVPYSTEGWGNAGDEVTVPYRRYWTTKGIFLSPADKWLFRRDATNKEYNHRFTLSADNPIINGYPYQTENLEYTFTGIEDVVYLSEAEDIEGMTKCTSDHALVRSSNAAAAYPADGDVELVTLPAGVYQLTAVMYNMHPTDSPYFDSDNPWTFLADGEPIATLTNDIANFDEKTTEPFVLTKETTLAIKQKGESQIGLDLIYIRRLQDNELYVAETPSVVAGWKTELNIGLRNVDAVNMTDFYLQLPEGMTIANSAVTIATDRSDRHQVSAQWNADGYYHIVSFSSQNNAFKLNDGTLFTMMIECDGSVAPGSYEAKVMTIVMSDTDKTELSQQDFTFTIDVPDLKLGDANGDTKINGLDIVETVDHIMQRPSDTFYADAVDLYYDKKINGLDLVRLINLVLSQPVSSQAAMARSLAPTTTAGGPWLETEGEALTMNIDAAADYILAQCVVHLDGDMQLRDVTADGRHTVAWQRLDGHRYAVVVYSTNNDAFEAGGKLLTLDVAGSGTVHVSDIMLVDTERGEHCFAAAARNASTGIDATEETSQPLAERYDLQGRKADGRQPSKGVYIIRGKKVVIK